MRVKPLEPCFNRVPCLFHLSGPIFHQATAPFPLKFRIHPEYGPAYTHTLIHPAVQKYTYIQPAIHTNIQLQIYSHTHSPVTNTNTNTCIHIYKHKSKSKYLPTHYTSTNKPTHISTHPHTHAHTYTHACTLIYPHIYNHPPIHSYT